MSFVYPWWLAALLPLLLWATFSKERFGRTSLPLPPKLIIQNAATKYHLLPWLLALLIIALARPVIERPHTSTTSIRPLFIALDVSASMRASDIEPSRLEWAKKAIKKLIRKAPLKTSLLVFTSNPLLIVPPTEDKEMALWALESFDTSNILTRSTDIQKLLNFVASFEGKKELVIFSDGGNAQSFRKPKNLRIHFVHTATTSGALIPTKDGYLKQEGKLVVTRLNEALAKIADFNYDTDNFLEILDNIEAKWSTTHKKERQELYWIPLLLAILLSLYIFTTLFDPFLKRLRHFLPLLLLVTTLHASILDEITIDRAYKAYRAKEYAKSAKLFDKLPYLEAKYGQALSFMHLGKYDLAAKILHSLEANDPKTQARILFAQGVCYEKMRNYEKALQLFIQAAQFDSDEKILRHIQKLTFKKNEKKPIPPFAKQRRVLKESDKKRSRKKGAGGSNMQSAALASNSQGGKKSSKKQEVLAKKGSQMPLSSELYETINKGYIHETTPW